MGNVIEIESHLKGKIDTADNQRHKLMADKEQLEKRSEEIDALLENNQDRADSYYMDELKEIEVELKIINDQIKVENHREWRGKEKMERYQRQSEK